VTRTTEIDKRSSFLTRGGIREGGMNFKDRVSGRRKEEAREEKLISATATESAQRPAPWPLGRFPPFGRSDLGKETQQRQRQLLVRTWYVDP